MALITGIMPRSPPLALPFIIWLHIITFIIGTSHGASPETALLLKFRESLQNNAAILSSWNESVDPCTGHHANWPHVLCYEGHIWGLQLEKMGLKGVIDVESLKGLPYLRTLSFKNNDFDSTWPDLSKISGLKAVYLSNNRFSGVIPDQAFQGMQWLKKVHLSGNKFYGSIPSSLTSLPRLFELRLEGNQFSGSIPSNFHPKLRSFSVANNHLVGEIPASLRMMVPSSFAGNKGLCGAPLKACPTNKKSLISIIVVAIVVTAALFAIAAVIFILHRKRRKQQRSNSISLQNPSPSSLQMKVGAMDYSSEEGSHRSTRSTRSNGSSGRSKVDLRLSFVRDDREPFDLPELLRSSAEILGSGCYSSSYKAALANGQLMVVKRFKQMNNVGREEFQDHMRRLGRLSHPNLIPLVAYYYRREEKLLVTDYVPNGSLAVRLHGYEAVGQPSLEWPTRLNIIKGISKGLAYLYKEMPSLIAPHGHLKSSNVLLNESLEPILTDYGLVPVINQELAPELMVIYKSPEYLQHGRITKKTDVWSLGILILEMLTGKFPSNFLQQGRGSELSLANWVDSVVPEEWSNEVFDKEMMLADNKEKNEVEMVKLLKIALACCETDVDKRLDLKEAVDRIQQVKEESDDDHHHHNDNNEEE